MTILIHAIGLTIASVIVLSIGIALLVKDDLIRKRLQVLAKDSKVTKMLLYLLDWRVICGLPVLYVILLFLTYFFE